MNHLPNLLPPEFLQGIKFPQLSALQFQTPKSSPKQLRFLRYIQALTIKTNP